MVNTHMKYVESGLQHGCEHKLNTTTTARLNLDGLASPRHRDDGCHAPFQLLVGFTYVLACAS